MRGPNPVCVLLPVLIAQLAILAPVASGATYANPFLPHTNVGDTPRGGGVESAGKDVHVQTGDDGANQLHGTAGADVMTGGADTDEFTFNVNPGQETLDEGDRITDYESGEGITITGPALSQENVEVTYDPEKDETTVKIDYDGPDGHPDGETDHTIILNGNKEGQVSTSGPCCGGQGGTIRIRLPQAPRTPKIRMVAPKKTAVPYLTPRQLDDALDDMITCTRRTPGPAPVASGPVAARLSGHAIRLQVSRSEPRSCDRQLPRRALKEGPAIERVPGTAPIPRTEPVEVAPSSGPVR